MIREEVGFLGCGFNKAKYAGKMKYCTEHGLDFHLYKLGPRPLSMPDCRSNDGCFGDNDLPAFKGSGIVQKNATP